MNLSTKLFIAATLIHSLSIAAESENNSHSTEAINQQVLTQESVAPDAKPTWKTALSSSYYDLEGTKYANANAYGFADVRVYIETFVLEHEFSSGWKGILRSEFVKNDFALLVGPAVIAEQSEGLGDTFLGVGHSLLHEGDFTLRAEGGLFVPTGSIGATDPYDAKHERYAYFMQIGSGTYDPTLNVYANYHAKNYELLAKFTDVERLGRNSDDYTLGHLYRGDVWAILPLGKTGLSAEALGYYRLRGSIQGTDPTIQVANSEYYHHDQIDWMTGVGMRYSKPILQQISLNAELVLPVQQGMMNYDHVVIATNYYGNINLTGNF